MSKPKPPTRETAAWMKYSGLAVQLIFTIGIFLGLGLWADGQLGTKPLLTVVGSLVGVIGGLWVALKDLR